MEVNPLRRALTAKTTTFVGLAIVAALVMMVIASTDSVGQAGAAQKKASPQVKSPFGAKEVINTTGDKALTGTYQKRRGGTLIISAAGSGWSSTQAKEIGMKILVNGKEVGTARVWTNEAESHKAFVPAFVVLNNVPKGQANIKLEPLNADTKIDEHDFFRVTVEEQPRG